MQYVHVLSKRLWAHVHRKQSHAFQETSIKNIFVSNLENLELMPGLQPQTSDMDFQESFEEEANIMFGQICPCLKWHVVSLVLEGTLSQTKGR